MKMEIVNIFNKYKVYIGANLLDSLEDILDLKIYSKIIVLTDDKIPAHFLGNFEKISISSGEENKTIETVKEIWEQLLKLGADRKTLVINLGGGVIGDMGGFAASTYMRGIKFLQVPTTLLSSVDASVGGKVGIDFAGVKNLVGSFNQPIGVVVDVDTFKSLPDREFISGFGEIIKHGIIADPEYFKMVISKKPRDFSEAELIEIIRKSCQIKADIISGDEKESGSRKLLNFGHTLGHALESFSLTTSNPLLHGEAVSIGMVGEAKISQEMGLIDESLVNNIRKVLKNSGLPVSYESIENEAVINLISKDKKAESGKVNWTLIRDLGEAITDQKVEDQKIITALSFISN
jgi:3-dehydroquinate synthase